MKKIPLRDLKINLSRIVSEAAKGILIQVTRYNQPYVYLFGNETLGVTYGSRVGKENLDSVLKGPTNGKWLEILTEDRSE